MTAMRCMKAACSLARCLRALDSISGDCSTWVTSCSCWVMNISRASAAFDLTSGLKVVSSTASRVSLRSASSHSVRRDLAADAVVVDLASFGLRSAFWAETGRESGMRMRTERTPRIVPIIGRHNYRHDSGGEDRWYGGARYSLLDPQRDGAL